MKKKLSTLMIVHLVLLILFLVATLVGGIVVATSNESSILTGELKIFIYIFALVNIVCLALGVVYILNGYEKKAALYYKGFMIAALVLTAMTVVYLIIKDKITISLFLCAIKVALLAIITFWKNLGKKYTVIVFFVIVAFDVVSLIEGIVTQASIGGYADVAIRLVTDGTIGLNIKGKYADKDARGTV